MFSSMRFLKSSYMSASLSQTVSITKERREGCASHQKMHGLPTKLYEGSPGPGLCYGLSSPLRHVRYSLILAVGAINLSSFSRHPRSRTYFNTKFPKDQGGVGQGKRQRQKGIFPTQLLCHTRRDKMARRDKTTQAMLK